MKEELPDNFRLCEKRLTSLVNRLKADPDKLKTYDEVIREQEVEGIIEKCVDFPPKGEVHYLPHHCVVNEAKETTKFRVVYDASSNRPSLNDCLEKEENVMPSKMVAFLMIFCLCLVATLQTAE